MSSIRSASSERYACFELVDVVVLERADHVADESLRVNISHTRVRITLLDHVSHGVHQMRLAQADAAIEKQRVVGMAGVFRHLIGRRARELVALAFDETAEREIRIEAGANDDAFGARGLRRDG